MRIWLCLALTAGCAPSAHVETSFAWDSICGSDTTRDEAEIAGSAPLCPGQTLVHGLLPDLPIEATLHLPAAQSVKYCLRDDNDELHHLRLSDSTGKLVVSLLAGQCAEQRLEAGDYHLSLTHAMQGIQAPDDSTPDIVYSALEGSGNVVTYTLQVNSIPKAVLDAPTFPTLARDGAGRTVAGFVGNFQGAKISNPVCKTQVCLLGSPTTVSDFREAQISNVRTEAGARIFLGGRRSPLNTFAGARVEFNSPDALLELGNLDGATLVGEVGTLAAATLPWAPEPLSPWEPPPSKDTSNWLMNNYLSGLNVKRASVLSGANLGVRDYDALRKKSLVFVEGNIVHVRGKENWFDGKGYGDLAYRGAMSNAANDFYFNGRDDDFSNVSFWQASLEDFTFRCSADAVPFNRRAFDLGTRLSHVAFNKCPFEDGTSLRSGQSVNATESKLRRAVLTASSRGDFSNVDLTRADLTGATFTKYRLDFDYDGFLGLRLVEAQAQESVFRGTFVDVDATAANLSRAKLGGVFRGGTFARASLDETRFETPLDPPPDYRETMDGVEFTGAQGRGTMFLERSLRGSNFSNVTFVDATFLGSDLTNTNFSGAWICGGNFSGANLTGANLSGALVTTERNTYARGSKSQICDGIVGWEQLATQAVARCPDGGAGPCTTEARWVPADVTLTCPPLGARKSRKAPGFTCATRCDCFSFSCSSEGRCE